MTVRAKKGADAWMLAPDYPFARWRNDGDVDIEARRQTMSSLTQNPLLRGLDAIRDTLSGCEFRCGERDALGLGVAFLTRGLAISLRSEALWQASSAELDLTQICDDGRLESEEIAVEHASSPKHIEEHEHWIRRRLGEVDEARLGAVATGAQLWSERHALFPALDFCDRIQSQLIPIGENHEKLPHIVERLHRLDRGFSAWTAGVFAPADFGIAARPQSEATLQKYRTEHTFLCPDGHERVFSWHTGIPGGWRIHFVAEASPKKMFIGHIGAHLPTMKFH